MYQFRALDNLHQAIGTSRLTIPKTAKRQERQLAGQLSIYTAEFRGALLQLFGTPLASSVVADEAFEYVIEAADEAGRKWLLIAYEGASGPAIGGDDTDRTIYPVAVALLDLIEATEPADFTATVYDSDTDNTTTYGCKGGQCFSWERRGNHI